MLGEPWESAAAPDWRQYEATLSPGAPAYLAEHRLFGTAVLPGVAYLEMALAAASDQTTAWRLLDVAWQQPLAWESDEAEQVVQTVLKPDGATAWRWEVFSRAADERSSAAWRRHAEGRLAPGEGTPALDIVALQGRFAEVPLEGYYVRLAGQGLEYGAGFRGLKQLWHDGDEALGMVELPEVLRREAGSSHLHPACWDACLHVLGGDTAAESDSVYVPVFRDTYQWYCSEHWL